MGIDENIQAVAGAISKTTETERSMTLALVLIFIVTLGTLVRFNGQQTSTIVERFNSSIDKNTDALHENTVVMTALKESLN